MVINTRTYADFKLAVASLRHLDALFYNDSANVQGSTYGVAYAFDYQSGLSVCLQEVGVTLSGVSTDFPGSIAISDHLSIQDASALSDHF